MTEAGNYQPSGEAVEVLQAGLAWLYDIDQPGLAIVDQFGVSCRAGDRVLQFMPTSAIDLPVIVVKVAAPLWVGTIRRRLTNPLRPGELALWSGLLRALGHDAVQTWNGTHETGSIALARLANTSLLAAFARYRQGCPNHRTVLCAQWRSDGRADMVPPAWPVPRQVSA